MPRGGHPYDALVAIRPGTWTSHQRPILRGQTRFVGQGALEYRRDRKGHSGANAFRPDAEDEHVFRRYFSRNGSEPIVRNGSYVEMGAYNGVTFSNTLFLERELGWSGLLVEANPQNFRELSRARGRPDSRNTLLQAAACAAGGRVRVRGAGVQSFVARANGSASAIVSQGHKPSASAQWAPCMPLQTMLARASIRHVHFFSLDVEGAELSVLRGFDWSVPIDVLMVEADQHTPAQARELAALLTARNFTFVRRMGSRRRNALYVGSTLLEQDGMAAVVAREQRAAAQCERRAEHECDLYSYAVWGP